MRTPTTRTAKQKAADKVQALELLRSLIKEGDTVYTLCRHVSASGMSRALDLYVMRDNKPRRITWSAAAALDWTYDRKREALKVGGCGMDMGFHTVYTLSRIMHPQGTEAHKDGGYCLNHEWI